MAATDSTFTDDIVRMYHGEFRGEALFSTIAANTAEAKLASRMSLLARLEHAMQIAIGDWLSARGIPHQPRDYDHADLVDHYGDMIDLPAGEFIVQYRPIMTDACERLAEWERGVPTDAATLARAIIEHDEVILELIDLVIAGAVDPSAAPVVALLDRLATPKSCEEPVHGHHPDAPWSLWNQ